LRRSIDMRGAGRSGPQRCPHEVICRVGGASSELSTTLSSSSNRVSESPELNPRDQCLVQLINIPFHRLKINMDRMSFVPGPQSREQMESCDGHMFFGRAAAIDFADEFISANKKGSPLLYQLMMTVLSDGDEIDITWKLTESDGGFEGFTRAMLKEAGGNERLLWEVVEGKNEGLADEEARKAFQVYRTALGAHLEALESGLWDSPKGPCTEAESPMPTSISCCFSPSNLLRGSGSMWYFVELGSLSPSHPDYLATLSRPMRAFEALALTCIIVLVLGGPPLAFAIRQVPGKFGKLPEMFHRMTYVLDDTDNEEEKTDLFVIC
jgi:hypothetical protein